MYVLFVTGSPPRVREKHAINELHRLRGGITPACAGKTPKVSETVSNQRDHPRVCGKNAGTVVDSEGALGSPPRVREKRGNSPQTPKLPGITPACAGKTLVYWSRYR